MDALLYRIVNMRILVEIDECMEMHDPFHGEKSKWKVVSAN